MFNYLTEDFLGISIPEHAIGGYALLEIKYIDIVDYLKLASEEWSKFMFNTEE